MVRVGKMQNAMVLAITKFGDNELSNLRSW